MPEVLKDIINHNYPDLIKKEGWVDIGCGKGWYPIVLGLCGVIDHYNKTRTEDEDFIPVHIEQIKEKFGGLRFYTGAAPHHIHEAITHAENLCDFTCEVCGLPGKARNLSWISTLCGFCYSDTTKGKEDE